MNLFKTLDYLRPHWFSIVVAAVSSVIVGFISSCISILIGPSLQILMNEDQTEKINLNTLFGANISFLIENFLNIKSISAKDLIVWLPFLIIIFALIKTFFSALQWFLWERLTEIASKKIRQNLVQLYLNLNPIARKCSSQNYSYEEDLSAVLANDIRIFKDYLVHFYGGIPREGLQVVFLMITLFLLSEHLFYIFFLGILPLGFVIRKLGISLKRRFSKALQEYSSLIEWLQQRFLGIETIKHHKKEAFEIQNMQNLNTKVFKLYFKTSKIKVLSGPLLEFFTVVLVAVVLWVSLYLISAGKTSASVQISFFSTLVLLSQSASKLGKYLNVNREGAAAKSRIIKIFDWLFSNQKPILHTNFIIDNSAKVPSIHCENIYVKYPESNEFALKNFNYIFDKAQIYCICGPSGSGKSTLFNLILGLIMPTEGNLYIKYCKSVKFLIGYVPQNLVLSLDSVAQNIAFPKLDYDRDNIMSSLKKLNLEHKIQSLSEGIDTVIADEGTNIFSGGEKQRIFLARLVYHSFSIILFDEGTSALDVEHENIIFNFLKEQSSKNNTLILMIAHRLSALSIADEILLLNKGELVASGSYEQISHNAHFQNFIGLIQTNNKV